MSAADILSGLHPTMALVLRPHLAVTSNVEPLIIYRARVGRKLAFRSQGDALAYERGYRAWPDPHGMGEYGTPQNAGWLDRQTQDICDHDKWQTATDDARRDAHAERMERDA